MKSLPSEFPARGFLRTILVVTAPSLLLLVLGMAGTARAEPVNPTASAAAEKIAPYQARDNRSRPLIAVIGENDGTVLTDFVVPYAVLQRSGLAEVVTVAVNPGPLKMLPALKIQPQFTIAGFERRYPQGADYVIVPAVAAPDDPALLAWLSRQAASGATLVSICDGALVVARTGLMAGHRATAHWASEAHREAAFPDVRWVHNTRYVADGKIVSSAGISAAIPVSIALVEAIGGTAKANALAQELGVPDWSTHHNSDAFQLKFGVNVAALITTNFTNGWLFRPDRIGAPVNADTDELALALSAEAYTRSGLAHVYALGDQPVRLRYGLTIVPDRLTGRVLDWTLPEPDDRQPAALALDTTLAGIAARYGKTAAYGVAVTLEYPGYQDAR